MKSKLAKSESTPRIIGQLFSIIFLLVLGGLQVVSAQIFLPSCTNFTGFPDDNDGTVSVLDVDKDNDGLIEVCDLEGLNEMRFVLDGSGYKANADATARTSGCPSSGCKGYELTKNLDFTDNDSYRAIANKTTWTTGAGFPSIGDEDGPFIGIFEGNGHTISNLRSSRGENQVGFFGEIGMGARVSNVGLPNVDTRGDFEVGGLAGENKGTITNSYAIATVGGNNILGGLVGWNNGGTITNSYAIATVGGNTNIGGLVGWNNGGTITNSYAMGNITGNEGTGGLIGFNLRSVVTNSYSTGNLGRNVPTRVKQTAEALKSPTASTGIYSAWNPAIWDFGTSDQFPVLKDSDSNTLFPYQGAGLRKLEVSTAGTRLSPTFGVSTTHYVITFLSPDGITRNIALRLMAYNPDATIEIIKQGENPSIDYFAGNGSSGTSNPVTIGNNTLLDITVSEANGVTTSYRLVGLFESGMPSCTTSLVFPDDNDGVAQALDIDKDNNGLIEVCDLEGLNEMRYRLDGSGYKASTDTLAITRGCAPSGCRGYELTRSLDFMVNDSYRATANKAIWTTGDGWEAVGNSFASPFNATFEGNGHTISNLMINRSITISIGLFGVSGSEAEITNLGLSNVDISGATFVGGLIGSNNNSTITSSYVTGNIRGSASVGGLVGLNTNGTIIDAYARASVTGTISNTGGLVGQNSGFITYSHATGSVVGGTNDTGGLVGSNTGTITNSYATGSVTGTSFRAGGLVGVNEDGTITNSYATGSVTASITAGGLVGVNTVSGTITNSYAMGDAVGIFMGGLVGVNSGPISQSYFLQKVGSILSGDLGVPADAEQTAEALKLPTMAIGIYSNWSPQVWDFGTSDQFPIIKDSNSNTLFPNQGMGLRELQVLTAGTELSPTFGVSTKHYVVAFLSPTGTDHDIVLALRAYNPNATIKIVKRGEEPVVDYFSGRGSNGESNPITIGDNTILDITVTESDGSTISYRLVGLLETGLPLCTISLEFPDDNDGILQVADIDKDNDGLIEICDVEGLNEMRYRLDGSGYRTSTDAIIITRGCASGGCRGYELTRSLDFMVDDSYRTIANKAIWTSNDGWQPVGTSANNFDATFDSNGYTLSNLMIDKSGSSGIGLFGYAGSGARIANLGLLNIDITGSSSNVGSLVGSNQGAITKIYVTGSVEGSNFVGGLVGVNQGTVTNSYATAAITGDSNTGNLVGNNSAGGTITNSYALGSAGDSGGLVGVNQGAITHSYTTEDVGIGVAAEVKQTSAALKSPTTATGIYSDWSPAVWDFGTSDQFPILKDADANTLFPYQGVGLRELEVLTTSTRLRPTFGISTTHYVIAFISPIGTTRSIVLRLTAYNPDATIEIIKQGDSPVIDYFAGKGSSGTSNPVIIGDNTTLNITVSEANGSTTSYRLRGFSESGMPPCTVLLEFPDDNDGVAQAVDVDKDNDGLIEICDVEGLNEIRYRLDGSGYKANDDAITISKGCAPGGCRGFELMRSLDFTADDSYRTTANVAIWTTNEGWEPIANSLNTPFGAIFDGNGHTLSNLMINRSGSAEIGLFAYTGSGAKIANVGLLSVDVTGGNNTGSLVGWNGSDAIVKNSYAMGDITGGNDTGGLVGWNQGAIMRSYAIVNVTGSANDTGGLVGENRGTITNSYATGIVTGSANDTGGLVGDNKGTITNSYATATVTGSADSTGGLVGDHEGTITHSYATGSLGAGVPLEVRQTAEALKSPTTATGIYSSWSTKVWDFGTADQFPLLKEPDSSTLFPNQGVGLRELEVLTAGMGLSPAFGSSTNHYVMAFFPIVGTTRSIILSLSAYNPKATIKMVKRGEDPAVDYFAAKGSSGISDGITIDENVMLDITVTESDATITSYSIVLLHTAVPLCTAFLNFPDDDDGVSEVFDVDKDNDGLIEICDLEGLNEMRYRLDGSSYQASADAMVIMTGCPVDGCRGFELTRSLDFASDDSYRTTANKVIWTTGEGWQPIADSFGIAFDAIFEGNGHTISNLMSDKSSANGIGLFGHTGSRSKIANLGLLNVDIRGNAGIGSLVGWNQGTITRSYAVGSVAGSTLIGGLAGSNNGILMNSYAVVNVAGSGSFMGGLTGENSGNLTNSYVRLSVTESSGFAGGLTGSSSGSISDSYWLKTGSLNDIGSALQLSYIAGQTAEALKSPTTATGIYGNWSTKIWDFGTSAQFPVLKNADDNTLLSNQGVGLRELQVLTAGMELSPTFGAATTHYVITFFSPAGTMRNIVLRLRAYNSEATIEIVKQGEEPVIDYFSGEGSSGTSDPISIGGNTILDITVSESDATITSYRIVSVQRIFPLCTTSLNLPDDNDGVPQAIDADKNNNGLIEICDLEGLNEIRHRLDGMGYKASADATVIMTGCAPGGCRGYELTKNLDFMDDDSYRVIANKMTWTTGNGWQPIADLASAPFGAIFDGKGYTISNLRINRNSWIGLFGYTQSGAEIANVGLLHVDIEGRSSMGSLVASNGGAITNSYATGDVRGSDGFVGGLVGWNLSNGSITNGYTTVNVTGGRDNVGGLVGSNSGAITNSQATGEVNGPDNTGGLVGTNSVGSITNSYATGNVNGSNSTGGLVGWNNNGTITNSHATGDIDGTSDIGGLIGLNLGTIMRSYATGDISGSSDGTGGLVGENRHTIINSYATGDVDGDTNSGGLVGLNRGRTENSYATGDVRGDTNTGGLAGRNRAIIVNSYATGSRGVGVPLRVTQTAEALKSPTTATGIYDSWSSEVWDFGTSDQFPLLKDTSNNALLPNQGMGLRELEVLTADTELRPTFGVSTTHYVIGFFSPTGTTRSTVLRLAAYNPEATIEIVKRGEAPIIDYFAGRGSSGQSDSITISDKTMLDITVTESDGAVVSYGIVGLLETNLPPCTTSINFPDDNDGVAQALDVDKDNDGLIEICDVEGVDEIRHRLDGTGYKTSANATVIMTGCAAGGCTGFELTRSLDFTVDASYRTTANKVIYTVDDYDDGADSGWQPIGLIANDDCSDSDSDCFSGIFDGNGHSIANLQINRDASSDNDIALFVANAGIIRNFGLSAITVEGNDRVGGLVGSNGGTLMNVYVNEDASVKGTNTIGLLAGRNETGSLIINSYARGTAASSGRLVGGICGINFGEITNSYAAAEVSAMRRAGGLVGENQGRVLNSYTAGGFVRISESARMDVGGLLGSLQGAGSVSNSYSIARVFDASNNLGNGGLIGIRESSNLMVTNSYWDTNTSQRNGSDGGDAKTTEELKMPTNDDATIGIYANWIPTDWDFGTSEQYPVVKYALGGDINNPACDLELETPLPDCGSLLPEQRKPPNTTPTITTTFPRSIALLEGVSTTLNVIVSDTVANDLSVNINSDNSTIATATIVSIDDDIRTLEIIGVGAGATTITATVDSGVKRAFLSFRVTVHANLGPIITVTPSTTQTMRLNSMSDIMKVSVADDNFHLDDRVTLEAISSSRTIVSVTPTRITNITTETVVVFVLNAMASGETTIMFLATDSNGLSDSGIISVRVNAPPVIAGIPTQAIRLLEGTKTELNVTINDIDVGDVLDVRIDSSDSAIATATIIATNGDIRTLEISGVSLGRAVITVTVDDGAGDIVQAAFTILIDAKPTGSVRIEPDSNDKWLLRTISTIVDANGIAMTSYQWFRDDSMISGATSDTYSIPGNKEARTAGTIYRLEATVVDNIGQSVTTQSNSYTVTNEKPVIESITDTQTIDEQVSTQSISVRVQVSDANYDDLTYSWSVTRGVLSDEEGDTATLDIPSDFVDAESVNTTANIEVVVSDGTTSTMGMTSIAVNKVNNGAATIGASIEIRSHAATLTVTILSGDPDGGIEETVMYQWQICLADADCSVEGNWQDIEGATGTSYSIMSDSSLLAENNRFRAKANYTDGQGYAEEVYSRAEIYTTRVSAIKIRVKVFLEGPLQ